MEFTVEISQQSTTNYNAELERELLLGKEPDIFCYTDAENMFSLAADGTAEPLDDWLEEFPTLKEAVSQDPLELHAVRWQADCRAGQ